MITRPDGVIHEIGSNRRTRITTEGSDTCKYYLEAAGEKIGGDIITGTYHIDAEYNEYAGSDFFTIMGGKTLYASIWWIDTFCSIDVHDSFSCGLLDALENDLSASGVVLFGIHYIPSNYPKIRRFIQEAHGKNIYVLASLEVSSNSFTEAMTENVEIVGRGLRIITEYNENAGEGERFDGVWFDVEIYADKAEEDDAEEFQARLYSTFRRPLHANRLSFGNALPMPYYEDWNDGVTELEDFNSRGLNYQRFSKYLDVIVSMNYFTAYGRHKDNEYWDYNYGKVLTEHIMTCTSSTDENCDHDGDEVRSLVVPIYRAFDSLIGETSCSRNDYREIRFLPSRNQIAAGDALFHGPKMPSDSMTSYGVDDMETHTQLERQALQSQDLLDNGFVHIRFRVKDDYSIMNDDGEKLKFALGDCVTWSIVPICGLEEQCIKKYEVSAGFEDHASYGGSAIFNFGHYYAKYAPAPLLPFRNTVLPPAYSNEWCDPTSSTNYMNPR